MAPSTETAAAPAASAASKAATTARARRRSASLGVNTAFTTSSWAGWMQHLPLKPMARARMAEVRRPPGSRMSTNTVSIGPCKPAWRDARASMKRACAIAPASSAMSMSMSSARSTAPNASRRRRGEASAMPAAAARPRAVSTIGMISMPPTGRPAFASNCASSQSTIASSAADSALGSTIPSISAAAAAWRSSKQYGVVVALTRRKTKVSRRDFRSCAAVRRACGFSATATASSRSRITPSAALANAFSALCGLVAGTNSRERGA